MSFPRIVKTPIEVIRDGKVVTPPIGKVFEFTAAEVDDLNKVNPDSIEAVEEAAAEPTAKSKKA